MAGNKKVYLMIKVRTHFEMDTEFNEFWGRESLPNWIKRGAKHIGSFTTFVGGPVNEIIRLFEFESIAKWEEFERFVLDTEEARKVRMGNAKYIEVLERKLLLSIYD